MGTWGEGVFENDSAGDLKFEMDELPDDKAEAELLEFIQSAFDDDIGVEDLDQLLAAVVLLEERYRRTGHRPPASLDRAALRTMMLEIYDDEIDGLEPATGFKEARRAVMQETLDQFVAL